MPTPAIHTSLLPDQSIIKGFQKNSLQIPPTVSYFEPWDLEYKYDNTLQNIREFIINNEFVKFQEKFTGEFERLKDYMSDLTIEEAKQQFSHSLSALIEMRLDLLAMEITFEKSIFYTIKHNDYVLFLQHFLGKLDKDDDEAMLTVFKGDNKLPSFAGSMNEVIQYMMSNLIQSEPEMNLNFLAHELS